MTLDSSETSASAKLRALDEAMTARPWGAAFWPLPEPTHWIGQHDENPLSSKMKGAVTGAVAEDDARGLSALRNALPAIAEVVEAAEQLDRDREAFGYGKSPHIPNQIALAEALARLSEALGDVT